jgi:hypothetical protein
MGMLGRTLIRWPLYTFVVETSWHVLRDDVHIVCLASSQVDVRTCLCSSITDEAYDRRESAENSVVDVYVHGLHIDNG